MPPKKKKSTTKKKPKKSGPTPGSGRIRTDKAVNELAQGLQTHRGHDAADAGRIAWGVRKKYTDKWG